MRPRLSLAVVCVKPARRSPEELQRSLPTRSAGWRTLCFQRLWRPSARLRRGAICEPILRVFHTPARRAVAASAISRRGGSASRPSITPAVDVFQRLADGGPIYRLKSCPDSLRRRSVCRRENQCSFRHRAGRTSARLVRSEFSGRSMIPRLRYCTVAPNADAAISSGR